MLEARRVKTGDLATKVINSEDQMGRERGGSMSDDYEFQCPVCEGLGGDFTRQMWGWGNCNIVETFRFITYHVSTCRAAYINIIWEQDDTAFTARRSIEHITDWDAFPHSNDWAIQDEYRKADNPGDLHKWWTDRLISDGYVKRAEEHNSLLEKEGEE